MLSGWVQTPLSDGTLFTTTVEFAELFHQGRGMPPSRERVVDTQVVTLPPQVQLPTTIWWAGNGFPALRINGQYSSSGWRGGGSDVTSQRITFEIVDTNDYFGTGFYSWGWLDVSVFAPLPTPDPGPTDTGGEGEVCDRCPTVGPTPADGLLRFYDGPLMTGGTAGIGPALQRDPVGAAAAGTVAPFGNGWSQTAAARLTAHGADPANPRFVSLAFGGTDTRVFRNVAAAGSPPIFERSSGQGSTDRLTVSGDQYVFRTASGSTFTFNGQAAEIPAGARGQLVSQTDAAGNRVTYDFNADGSPAAVRSYLGGWQGYPIRPPGPPPLERHDYVYLPAGDPNAGKVSRIDIRRGDGVVFRTVHYAYYGTSSAFGMLGDLMSVTVRDPAGAPVDGRHYRYTPGAGGSLVHATFDFDAVRRATHAGLNLATASHAAVAPYATNVYAYDGQNRVVRHDLQGAGCSSCTGGVGAYTYAYAQSTLSVSDASRDWRSRLTQTRPDGTQRIVYVNGRGQPMLEVIRTTDGGVTRQAGTYTRFDSRGLPIWVASPEAVTLPADLAQIEQHRDLLNGGTGNFQYISDQQGLIEVTNYFTTTTATATTAGGVDRFVSSLAVMRGELGAAITQEAFTYFVQSSGGDTLPVIASHTTYPNATTADAQTTTYGYSFTPGTIRVASQRTTLPIVTTTHNGPGTAVVVERHFDAAGREIWSKDGDGFLHYTEYDPATGAAAKSIVDVDTSRSKDFLGLPAGWVTTAAGGRHVVTTAELDRLGRPVTLTDPEGKVTFLVYDDAGQSVRTYVGWNTATKQSTGPITVSRRDLSGTYTESLTYSATPAVDWQGRPTGTEPITNMQSLTRSHFNAAGQVIAVDRYTSLEGLAYSTAATVGVEGVNYLRTRYAYNNQGQVDRVQSPAGTITISTYDGLSRVTGTWVGTTDSTTNGFKWRPTNASPASNMVQVSAYEYDNGGTGNGLLTRVTEFPGDGGAPRTTQHAYDWRGRLVATKAGATTSPATEDQSVNRPFTSIDYDNLGRITQTRVFDGDRVTIADANADGIPDAPAAGLLRGSQVSFYDSQDRVYRTQELFVDQATGAVASPRLSTNVFYDRRGNVAAVYAPDAPVMQHRYDGAGRLTASFTLGNVPLATWANATSLAASLVIEQTEVGYDAASNVILTTTRQRFHDASTAVMGQLGTPTAGIPARVSYAASYYDAADRPTASVNVGTNGGVGYVRPATLPARSATTLVTTYAYGPSGRVQDVTDPMGIVTRTRHDALGRTTATIENFTGGAPAAQTDVTTLFTFDSGGRLASRTAVQPTGRPSQVTGYVYGISPATGSGIASNDILTETRYPDPVTGQPSAAERDVYTTNALGERTSFTDRAGTTRTFTYDILGRRTADAVTALGTDVDGAVRRIDSAYDTLGRLTTVTARSGVTATSTAVNQVTRAYNGFGQLTSEWQAHTGLVSTATTPRVQYAYSQALGGNHSRLTRTIYPSGYAVDYAYAAGIDSAVSRPSWLSGQRANTTTPVTLEAFRYLGSGTVIERSRPEVNVTLSMVNFSGATADAGDKYTGLDRFGRVADQRWTKGTTATSPVLDRSGYTYDRNSNRLTRSNALATAFGETYAYDNLNQVQSFRRGTTPTPATSQEWQFDALGNWTSVTTNGNTVTRTANAQNEYTHNGTGTFGYTPTGNLATNPQGRVFAYDAWNRLVSVREPDGTLVARYEYDGLARRIVEQTGTASAPAAATAPVRDLYYSQGWQVLEERVRTPAGAIPATADTRFIWSPVYVDAMVARDRNADNNSATGTGGLEERVYALQDANWNTTAIIAATGVPGVSAGNVISRFVYTPYGQSQTLTASWATPPAGSPPAVPWAHLFQGLEFTDATRLTHARHRDYSVNLGRFIQRDPIGFAAGDNNWYRFVGNGPTGKVDPSGLCELGNVYDSYGRMGADLERDRLRNLANASDGAAQTQLFMQLFAGRAGVHDLYADHGFPISARPYGGGSTAYRFADGTRYFEPSEPSTGKHLDVVAVFFPPLDAAMSAGDIYRDPLNPWSYATTIPGVPAGASRLGSGASRAGRCAAPVKRLPLKPTLLQKDLDHIIARHWATSGARGSGKFVDGTTGKNLLDMVNDAVHRGASRPNTNGRAGTIFELDFGRPIGFNTAGNIATKLRVVLRPDGTVLTAFPF